MAGALPTNGKEEDNLHVLGAAPQKRDNIPSKDSSFGENLDLLSMDARKRNIVWDAEIRTIANENRLGEEGQEQMPGLLGQRMNNGEIVPVAKSFSGKPHAPILHVDQLVSYHACAGHLRLTSVRAKHRRVSWKRRKSTTRLSQYSPLSLSHPLQGVYRHSLKFLGMQGLTSWTQWHASTLKVSFPGPMLKIR